MTFSVRALGCRMSLCQHDGCGRFPNRREDSGKQIFTALLLKLVRLRFDFSQLGDIRDTIDQYVWVPAGRALVKRTGQNHRGTKRYCRRGVAGHPPHSAENIRTLTPTLPSGWLDHAPGIVLAIDRLSRTWGRNHRGHGQPGCSVGSCHSLTDPRSSGGGGADLT